MVSDIAKVHVLPTNDFDVCPSSARIVQSGPLRELLSTFTVLAYLDDGVKAPQKVIDQMLPILATMVVNHPTTIQTRIKLYELTPSLGARIMELVDHIHPDGPQAKGALTVYVGI